MSSIILPTATLIRDSISEDGCVKQSLFLLNTTVDWISYSEPEAIRETKYVVASSSTRFADTSQYETFKMPALQAVLESNKPGEVMIFPANADGETLSSSELYGQRKTIDIDQVMRDWGYKIIYPVFQQTKTRFQRILENLK